MDGKRIPLPATVLCLVLAVLSVGSPARSAASELLRIRHSSTESRTRVVLDCSRPTRYRIRRVGSPERIVIDLGAASSRRRQPVALGDGRVRRVRINELGPRVQVVLDLKGRHPYRDFTLAPSGRHPFRIVIDVLAPSSPAVPASGSPAAASTPPKKAESTSPKNATRSSPGKAERAAPKTLHAPGEGRPYVIVIDPGHGGHDPGTRGCGVIREKELVLGIAREMARQLRERTDFKVILTRSSDRFVALDRRVDIARRSEGDLFVSIHANSARSRSAKGVEVYFLSPRGATDQAAAELADRENAAHMVGMDSVVEVDEVMMSILMDLQSSGILRRSGQFAELALQELSGMQKLDARFIKQARFAVLRTLSMPSILVEVGYLSNRSEARYLKKPSTQRKIGRALAETAALLFTTATSRARPSRCGTRGAPCPSTSTTCR